LFPFRDLSRTPPLPVPIRSSWSTAAPRAPLAPLRLPVLLGTILRLLLPPPPPPQRPPSPHSKGRIPHSQRTRRLGGRTHTFQRETVIKALNLGRKYRAIRSTQPRLAEERTRACGTAMLHLSTKWPLWWHLNTVNEASNKTTTQCAPLPMSAGQLERKTEIFHGEALQTQNNFRSKQTIYI